MNSTTFKVILLTLTLTLTPIMHLICPPPPAPPVFQGFHNFCFSFLLGITAVPREIENNAYAKFWGQIRCIMGNVEDPKALCELL